MQITTVDYHKLTNLRDYENERIGAWANVGDDETPEAALAQLTAWVEEQGNARGQAKDDLARLQQDVEQARGRTSRAQREYEEMFIRWKAARAFLEKIGLELPRCYIAEDDIPF